MLLRVAACAVCRTDLHVVDGELPDPKLPLVPGHEIVGRVDATGAGVEPLRVGDRVGVPWLGWTCGECALLPRGAREPVRPGALHRLPASTAAIAEYAVADARFCFPLPDGYRDVAAAPLLCAGLIGYRALRMAGDARPARALRLRRGGAHRRAGAAPPGPASVTPSPAPGDEAAQAFARELGAEWAGGSDERAARAARRRDHLRARRRAGAGGAARDRARAARWSAAAST